jgi:hypothetical protein
MEFLDRMSAGASQVSMEALSNFRDLKPTTKDHLTKVYVSKCSQSSS